MASPGLAIGAGIARGLEKAYSRHLDRKEAKRQEDRADALREFSLLYPQAAANAEATGDYAALEDFIGQTFPKTAAKTKERRAAKGAAAPRVQPPTLMPAITGVAEAPAAGPAVADVTQQAPAAVAPTTGALAPTTAQPVAQPVAQPPAQPSLLPSRAAVSPGTPAPQPAAEQDFFGMTMQTPAQRRQAALDDEIGKLQATRRAWVSVARKLLPELQANDPSITLEDVLRYVSKGELMRDPAASGSSAGVAYNRAAIRMGYASATAVPANKRSELDQLAQQITAELAGAGTTGRGEAAAKIPLSTAQRFQALTDLQNTWRKVEGTQKEMTRQLQLMETGLRRFGEGDKIGGSQAVLVTFQKILDPLSVVRESEYARTGQGLQVLSRLQGMYDRYIGKYDPATGQWTGGGAGVPEKELAAMVETARQFVSGLETWNTVERDRLDATAKDYGLDATRIFGQPATGAAPRAAGQPPPPAGPATAKKDASGRWVITTP